jgi:hypothetical protein
VRPGVVVRSAVVRMVRRENFLVCGDPNKATADPSSRGSSG